jgi:hypothetical protein
MHFAAAFIYSSFSINQSAILFVEGMDRRPNRLNSLWSMRSASFVFRDPNLGNSVCCQWDETLLNKHDDDKFRVARSDHNYKCFCDLLITK